MLRPLSPAVRLALEAATPRYEAALDAATLDYLSGRGITEEIAKCFRLGKVVDPVPGHERMAGRLAIPSIGAHDTVQSLRFRSLDGGDPKYLGSAGVDLRLFNVRALHNAGETIHVTEGEMDAISLAVVGLDAVGVPGAKTWKKHHPRVFAGFSRVFVWPDGDPAGREFAEKLARDIDAAVVVPMPDGMDVNQLLIEQGKDAILAMAC